MITLNLQGHTKPLSFIPQVHKTGDPNKLLTKKNKKNKIKLTTGISVCYWLVLANLITPNENEETGK